LVAIVAIEGTPSLWKEFVPGNAYLDFANPITIPTGTTAITLEHLSDTTDIRKFLFSSYISILSNKG